MKQLSVAAAAASLLAAACGDNIDPSEPPVPVGVSARVSGLTGSGLVLSLNGRETAAVAADGTIAFSQQLMPGSRYEITVASQPVEPAQVCSVINGAGTVGTSAIQIAVSCAISKFVVGGAISGLEGSGLVLENNGTDATTITANGSFAFAEQLASGTAFDVSIASQPRDPVQTCSVSGAHGVIGAGPVTSVVVNCATDRFTVGGSISGLDGTVVLQNNGGDNVALTSNGEFAFLTTVASGQNYAVTVLTQPDQPSQTCTVTEAAGKVDDRDITDVRIECETNHYAVGGTVTGLEGDGLVLQVNGGETRTIEADGSFAFPTRLPSGDGYGVIVLAQPSSPTQKCSVIDGEGIIGGADVTDVAVHCTTTPFSVIAHVEGVLGQGLTLLNNNTEILSVTTAGDYTFSQKILSGQPYSVTVGSQPTNPSQTCTVSAGNGTVGAGNVESVTVNCATDQFTVGGTVSGLQGTVLISTGTDVFALASNGEFALPSTLPSGAGYSLTVQSQPTLPSQTCTITNSAGTVTSSNVTNIAIECSTNAYAVQGTVSGLDGSGLSLRNNAGAPLFITKNGTFTFALPVTSGDSYAVTVASQPTQRSQTCTVSHGSGVVTSAAITNVAITCTTNQYAVGGTLSGLLGEGLQIRANGTVYPIYLNGTYAIPYGIASGDTYEVSIEGQPTFPWQTCVLSNGTGTVVDAPITNINVECTTNSYLIHGTVNGLAANTSGISLRSGDSLITTTENGEFTFPMPVSSGQPFEVTIETQPSLPAQTCTIDGNTGVVNGADIHSVSVNCTTNQYSLGGSISGLAGSEVVLANNGHVVEVSANGTFSFQQLFDSGQPYNVTVEYQPTNPWQHCTVSQGEGTIGAANISDVVVECTTTRFSIGGGVWGLTPGSTVLLRNNGANDIVIGNGLFSFPTTLYSGSTYNVTVHDVTGTPAQSCIVYQPTGVVQGSAIINIGVECWVNKYALGGTVSGLDIFQHVTLTNNGTDDIEIAGNGVWWFNKSFESGSLYNVTIKTQPYNQTCTVHGGTGLMGSDLVDSITVVCETNPSCGYDGEQCCIDGCFDGLSCNAGTCAVPACPPDHYFEWGIGCVYEPAFCGWPGEDCCGSWCDIGLVCSPWNTCEPDYGGIPGGY